MELHACCDNSLHISNITLSSVHLVDKHRAGSPVPSGKHLLRLHYQTTVSHIIIRNTIYKTSVYPPLELD